MIRGDGIQRRDIAIIATIVLLQVICCFSTGVVAEETTLSINIIGEEPIIDHGKQVIVASIWHEITFSYDEEQYSSIILRLFKGDVEPTVKNNTNYFSWTYNKNDPEHWQADSIFAKEYMQVESCLATEKSITFCVGVKDNLPDEIYARQDWTLQVQADQYIVFTGEIIVEKPTRGFAKSHGDHISFNVDPFTIMQVQASDYIILKNTGNIPLEIKVSYGALDDYLKYIEKADIISPYSSQKYSVLLNAPSWQPQRIEESGLATAKVISSYIIEEENPGTSISLNTALVINPPPINIFVGHSTHILQTLNEKTGFSFQYPRSVTIEEGETKTLKAYVSGEGTAEISISVNKNISLLSLSLNDQGIIPSFMVVSTSDKEQVISFDIQSISENNDGVIYYTIETDGKTRTYTTNVQVIIPTIKTEETSVQGTSIIAIFVLIALIVAAAYMLYNHLIHGRKG